MKESPTLTTDVAHSPFTKNFNFFLAAFNLVVLAYVFTIGYYNQLALDDYAYLGMMRDYGFFSPFKYWYFNWQGRFAPQFLLNGVFLVYEQTHNLLFYTVFLTVGFIYCIYQILKSYFSLPKFILFNYSLLLFSAMLLTSFDLSIFYWVNASTMYYGGVLFALLGIVFILKEHHTILHHVVIAICFLYAASSSEHVGVVSCFLLFFILTYNFYRSNYKFRDFFSHTANKAILTAFIFSSIAFVVMVVAPGNSVRVSVTEHTTDPLTLLRKSYDATMFVCGHFFYKFPQIIVFVPAFVLFGSYLKEVRFKKNVNIIFLFFISSVAMLIFIFAGNLPLSYAIGRPGPLRAYAYVGVFTLALLFLLCVYGGYRYQVKLKSIKIMSIISLALLFAIIFYTFYEEFPLIKKYSASVRQRVILLERYKMEGQTEPVYVPPLFDAQYHSINDKWRDITYTNVIPSAMIDMPLLSAEIGDPPDWRNSHLKVGLGLNFNVFLSKKETPSDK